MVKNISNRHSETLWWCFKADVCVFKREIYWPDWCGSVAEGRPMHREVRQVNAQSGGHMPGSWLGPLAPGRECAGGR